MSLIFSTDTSTQLNYSNFGFTTPQLDNYTTSNQLLISSTSSSNFTTGTSNILVNRILSEIKNTSNYTLTVQGILQNNINTVSSSSSNFTIGTSNILVNRILSEISNTSNYVTNTSNLLRTLINDTNNNISTNYFQKSGGTITGDTSVNANLTTRQLYINSTTSTASIFLNPVSTNYSILKAKTPWAMYFAEDYNSSSPLVLPNYINNGRDAVLGGTAVSKLTQSGNGASGAITYISGTTGSTVVFAAGSIPSTFTILSLTRYTGATDATRKRILQSTTGNWLHGHWDSKRGVAYYENWKTSMSSSGTQTDWLCFIGKNSGGTAGGNILADGAPIATGTGGQGNLRLTINTGSFTTEFSDWALSCVMIWDTELSDAEMLELNAIVNTYKTTGVSIKSLIVDDTIIESRNYNGEEKTELLLFKGNDIAGTNGEDRIRLKAGSIAFDTYTELTPAINRGNENIVMFINGSGNVGIGTTTNLTHKLNINGSLNATTFSGSGASLTSIPFSALTGTSPYLLKTSDTISGTLSFSSPGQNFLIYLYGTSYGFGINADTLRYNAGLNGTHKFYTESTLTASISKTGLITAVEGFSGNGSLLTNLAYANITGKPSTFTPDMTNIYTKTETDGRYLQLSGGTMTGQISGITTLNATTINSSTLSTTNNGGLSTPSVGVNGGTGDRLILWTGTASIYPFSLGINSSTLWYSIPTSSSHKFYVGGSLITTISPTGLSTTGIISGTTFSGSGSSLTDIPFTALTGTSPYVLKTGDTMTGQLQLTGNNSLYIYSSVTNAINNIELKNNLLKSCYIGIGGSGYTGNYIDTLFIQSPTALILNTNGNGTAATPNFIIKNNGNIGIGNLTADAGKLCIGSSVYGDGVSDGSLVISKNNAANAHRSFKFGYDANYNFCMGDNLGNGTYTWRSTDFNIRYFDGNIGMGTTANGTYKLDVNSSLNATTIYRAGVEIDSRYLQLSGGTMTGTLTSSSTITGATVNCCDSGTITAAMSRLLNVVGTTAVMRIWRNDGLNSPAMEFLSGPITSASSYTKIWDMGIGGTTGNNYFYIRDRKPPSRSANRLLIDDNGNIGIGTDTPSELLHLYTTGTAYAFLKADAGGGTGQAGLRLFAGSGTTNRATRIDFFNNVASTASARWSLISDTDQNGTNDFRIYNAGGVTNVLTLLQSGNVGIGITNPNNILQVGDGGKFRISNGISDYTLIGTKDVDNATNTRIVIGGNTRANYTYKGSIEYIATSSTGHHIFYSSDNANYTERMRIANNGNISCTNDFTAAGPITSTSTTPSAFSFINIAHPTRTTHIPFSDNAIYLRAPVIIDFDSLSFGSRINDYLINLYGGAYGFGINANTLRYNSADNHSFYSGGIMKANINNSGTIEATTFSGTTVLASGTSKASKFMIRYGEQTGYNYNWNGTGLQGWFIGLNQFWSANSDNAGTAYLTMTVCGSTNSQYCWFGRVFVKGDGYTWSIITDYKTPTSGSFELFVTEHFDGSGNNVLRFRTGTPGVLTENLRFKICG